MCPCLHQRRPLCLVISCETLAVLLNHTLVPKFLFLCVRRRLLHMQSASKDNHVSFLCLRHLSKTGAIVSLIRSRKSWQTCP